MKKHFFVEPYSKVVGAISPIEWDKKGTPSRYSVFTEWGEDYIITNSKQRKMLKPFLNKVVEAYGNSFTNDYGEKFINIKKLNLLGFPGSSPIGAKYDDSDTLEEFPLHISYQDHFPYLEENVDELSTAI